MPEGPNVAERLRGDTGRLAGTYLIIIMGLTILFSGIIYAISSSQLDRQFQQRGDGMIFDEYTWSSFEHLMARRAEQARLELLASLVLLNLAVLVGGAFFSYFLARKTLEPIEDAMRSQVRFVSDASHELRTPLTALQVTNEVALRKKKLSLAEAKELIGHNLAETIKLRTLSESLLGLARQESADTTVSTVHIPEVVLDAVQTLSPLAADKQVKLAHDILDISVDANAPAVTQILRILLDNAIKYSAAGSTVTVSARQQNGGASITVSDTGVGIAPEHQTKIFDRFYRIDESRSSQHIEGSGLGLSIAKAIADRHGYGLSVDSAPNKGSAFTLALR